MKLTKEESDELNICIDCRLGIIETGVPMRRVVDAVNMNMKDCIKALTSEQMKLILMLENLRERISNNKG